MAQTTTTSPTPSAEITAKKVDLRMPKEVEEWLQTLSPGMFQNFKDIESTWNHPMTQFSVSLVGDAQFRNAVSDIHSQEHACQKIITYELVLIIAIWILRAWRLSKASTWLVKFWVQCWVGAVFWLFSLLVVPLAVWGAPYKTLLGQLLKVMLHQFF